MFREPATNSEGKVRGRKSEPKNGHSMLCACGMHCKCERKRTSDEAGGRRETRGRRVEERCAVGGLLGGGGEVGYKFRGVMASGKGAGRGGSGGDEPYG